MSVNITKAVIWKIDTPNTPGAISTTLNPLAEHGVNLDLVMGFTNPDKTVASIEVFPVNSTKAQKEARKAGFSKAEYPCIVVQGKNEAGLGRRITSALSEAGINVNFFVAQAIGSQYVGLFSFEAQSEANLAVKVLRSALKNGASATVARKTKARVRN